jgi:hypothetical protein
VKSVRQPVTLAEHLAAQVSAGLEKFDASPPGDYRVVVYATFEPQLISPTGVPLRGTARQRVDDAGMTHVEIPDGSGGWREPRPPWDFFDPLRMELNNMVSGGSPPGATRATEVVVRMDNGVTRTYRRDANNHWSVVP